jgi:hypothetical protein
LNTGSSQQKQPTRRRNTFPIDKKTRDLIKRKNTLSKNVVSSSDPATCIRQEYNRVRNKRKVLSTK